VKLTPLFFIEQRILKEKEKMGEGAKKNQEKTDHWLFGNELGKVDTLTTRPAATHTLSVGHSQKP
tara:strand:- start:152 stop:346 length:195 start_codon:yes stop_codon:yes gene_type:complete